MLAIGEGVGIILSNSTADAGHPRFSPDSTRILFTEHVDADGGVPNVPLWAVDRDGRHLRPVTDPSDPGTQINTRFIQTLLEADLVAIAGEAGSHCLANTVRDIARNFGDDSYIQRLVLLEDATCPVPGFEALQSNFVKEMRARGMQVSTTQDFLS